MPQINVPFELEPWCEGCDQFEVETERIYLTPFVGDRKIFRSCKYLKQCRAAVASAQRLSEQGGDADG